MISGKGMIASQMDGCSVGMNFPHSPKLLLNHNSQGNFFGQNLLETTSERAFSGEARAYWCELDRPRFEVFVSLHS